MHINQNTRPEVKVEENFSIKEFKEDTKKVESLPKEEEKAEYQMPIKSSIFVNQQNITCLTEDYEELELLGEGAFGKVNKVRHKPSGQIRALKIIKRENFKKAGSEELMMREIEVLKRLVG